MHTHCLYGTFLLPWLSRVSRFLKPHQNTHSVQTITTKISYLSGKEGEGDGDSSLFGPGEILCPVGTVTQGSPLPGFDPALPEECDPRRACLARESLEIGSSAGAPSTLFEATVVFFPPSYFSSLRVMILLVTSRSDLCRSTYVVSDFVCPKFILCSALSVVLILNVHSKKQ